MNVRASDCFSQQIFLPNVSQTQGCAFMKFKIELSLKNTGQNARGL